jgi:hypothetical protein
MREEPCLDFRSILKVLYSTVSKDYDGMTLISRSIDCFTKVCGANCADWRNNCSNGRGSLE